MTERDSDLMEEDDTCLSRQVKEDLQGSMSHTSSHTSSIDGEQGSVDYDAEIDTKNVGSAAELVVQVEPTKHKRAQLSSTGSITGDVQAKKRRKNLRSTSQRRLPARFNDFIVHATISTCSDGYKGLLKRNVKILKNHAEALRYEYARKWCDAELEELEALKTKGVLGKFR